MRYLLDTDHCIQLERGDPRLRARLRSLPDGTAMAMSVVTHSEVLFGILRMAVGRRRTAAEQWHASLTAGVVDVIPVSREVAEHCAAIRSALADAGHPLPVNDMWIASTARSLGMTLVTHDQHFQDVPGLLTEDWLAAAT